MDNCKFVRSTSSIWLTVLLGAALGVGLAACSDSKSDGAGTAPKTAGGETASGDGDEPSYEQPRVGVQWCDKLLAVAECTAPRYKKKDDRIEAAAVWRMRAEQWKQMDADEANQQCEKKYQDDKAYAPEYEDGLMVSCYE